MLAIFLVTVFSCLLGAGNVAAVGFGADCTGTATCDGNTKCSPTTHKCVCSDGFTETSGVCTKAVSGAALKAQCTAADGCTDHNAECSTTSSSSTCECKTGFTEQSGVCSAAKAGSGAALNTKCTDADGCADKNAQCSSSLKCECKTGFTEQSGVCNGGVRLSFSSWFITGSIIMLLMTLSLP